MITALHALLYSDTNSEPGWLIFRSGPSEIGVHPNSWTYGGESTTVPVHHEISLMCDDLAATMEELRARGAEFNGEPVDYGYGLMIKLRIPAAGEIQLYQPNYQPSYGL